MSYIVEMLPAALRDFQKLDKVIAGRVLRRLKWLSENFDTVTTEALTGEWKGLFKLKAGSYRVLYSTDRNEHAIFVHLIGDTAKTSTKGNRRACQRRLRQYPHARRNVARRGLPG
ncbi:MAG: type II toxin-antitoxin system RelE/ParE family toxin [Chloroflexi bacterium]|nr:type II toxin-antitoxin system RelE/ParE family toxin [Chloroflexota bacterium]